MQIINTLAPVTLSSIYADDEYQSAFTQEWVITLERVFHIFLRQILVLKFQANAAKFSADCIEEFEFVITVWLV